MPKQRTPKAYSAELNHAIASLREEIFSYCSKNGGYLASDLSSSVLMSVLYSYMNDETELYLCQEHNDLYPILNKLMPKENVEEASLAYAFGRALRRNMTGNRKKIYVFLDSEDLTAENREILKQIGSYEKQLFLIVHEHNEGYRHLNLLKKGISTIGNTAVYNNLKTGIKRSLAPLKYGDEIIQSIHTAKSSLKKAVWNEGIFRELDLDYYGPYEGNDPKEIRTVLEQLSVSEHPLLVHFICEEENVPVKYRDLLKGKYVEPFDLNTGKKKLQETDMFRHSASLIAEETGKLMNRDPSICFYDLSDSDRFLSLSASYPDRYMRFDLSSADLLRLATGSSNHDASVFLPTDADTFLQNIRTLKELSGHIIGRFLIFVSFNEVSDLSFATDLKGYQIYVAKDAEDIIHRIDDYEKYDKPFILIYPDRFLTIKKIDRISTCEPGIGQIPVNNKKGKRAVIADGTDYEHLRTIVSENECDIDLYRLAYISPFPEKELSEILNSYEKVYIYHSCMERLIRDQVNIHNNGSVVQYLGKDDLSRIFEDHV